MCFGLKSVFVFSPAPRSSKINPDCLSRNISPQSLKTEENNYVIQKLLPSRLGSSMTVGVRRCDRRAGHVFRSSWHFSKKQSHDVLILQVVQRMTFSLWTPLIVVNSRFLGSSSLFDFPRLGRHRMYPHFVRNWQPEALLSKSLATTFPSDGS